MTLHNILLHFFLSGNTGTGFSITDDGLLSVATALDAETTSFYSLEITATDRHSTQPLSSTAKVSVTVTGKLGNKFVSYIHEMDRPHKNPITIYGTTRHLESLDVTLHH